MSTFDDPEMQEIFEGFLVETRELLDNISQDLMLIETTPDDLDLINQIFRSFHTIKGTSSFMGFAEITTITHEAEDLLNKLRRAELVVTNDITDVLLEVHDWIETLVERINTGQPETFDYSATIKRIIELRDGKVEDVAKQEAEPELEVKEVETKKSKSSKKSKKESTAGAMDAVLNNPTIGVGSEDFTDDELEMLQAAFAEINSNFDAKLPINASEQNIDEKATEIKIEEPSDTQTNLSVEVAPVQNQSVPEVIKSTPQAAQQTTSTNINQNKQTANTAANSANDTIRIDVSRVETLMDLSGELVLGRNRLSQITERLEQEFENKDSIRDLIETAAQVDFVTSEIQSAVMKMRMVQVGKLYQKAPRIVRDLAKEFNKKIKLVVKGEETEIDRGIIEELNDPLVHMIRNSCDHGIESLEERVKAGKSEEGTIILDAEQEGNHIVLRIIDDGKGMDPEKLKSKALEKGIITQEQASTMTLREAYQLIFLPGFSMAQKVSSVSGRGVGMDVVRTNIQKLKGIIEIDSELGKGSTFVIKLPLTLAIIQGLLVKVLNESYAIPLSSVEEVVAVDIENVYTVQRQEVIRIREDVIPILKLENELGVSKSRDASLEGKYVVIVGLGIQRIGLVVDELLGQQEIVIKSLGEYLGNIAGISGSTILGDGRVIMIIDISELVNNIYASQEYSNF